MFSVIGLGSIIGVLLVGPEMKWGGAKRRATGSHCPSPDSCRSCGLGGDEGVWSLSVCIFSLKHNFLN